MNPLQAAADKKAGGPAGAASGTAGEAGESVAEGGGPAGAADRLAGEVGGSSGEKADETVDELCFVARALAQTHPMTEAAHRYRQRCHETERSRQPVTELADWASTALLVGYCLRRAEEQRAEAGGEPAGSERAGAEWAGPAEAGPDDLAPAIAAAAESLRTGEAERVTLLDPDVTVSALDRVIATELDKRQEHLREQLDDQEWSELEDYIAWWTVHGYALRAVEFP